MLLIHRFHQSGFLQSVVAAWMVNQELTRGIQGGIFADDMGVGKTVHAVNLIMNRPLNGLTLVVAPKSVLTQLLEELSRFDGLKT